MSIGLGMYFITEINASSLGYFAIQVGSNFHQCLVWTIAPYVIQVLLKYLKNKTGNNNEDLVEKCKKCLQIFETLTLREGLKSLEFL